MLKLSEIFKNINLHIISETVGDRVKPTQVWDYNSNNFFETGCTVGIKNVKSVDRMVNFTLINALEFI